MPTQPALHDLRQQLERFDDVRLDALCLDHFPEVYHRFGRGMQRDEKVTLLLDHCRRRDGLARLADLLAAPDSAPSGQLPLNPEEVAAYLEAVCADCAAMDPRIFLDRSERRGATPRLPLLTTYEPLRFDLHPNRAGAEAARDAQGAGERMAFEGEVPPHAPYLDVDLLAALAAPGHLVLLGKAGSGKTTVLRWVTAVLAAADADLARERLGVLPSSEGLLPIPVRLPLREFEYACKTRPERCGYDVASLLAFLDDAFEKRHPGRAPSGFVSGLVRAGRAWLLLDGLDEVAEHAHRVIVREVIEGLAGAFPGNRLLVTARAAAYDDANTRLDGRFNLVYVRDLIREQWAPLMRRIYAGLEASSEEAGRRADRLLARVDGSELLQEMVKTPLMVWTATLIHYAEHDLPEQRAQLYGAYVDVLLGARLQEQDGAQSAHALLRDLRWSYADRRWYLTYAAYKVHEGASSVAEDSGSPEPRQRGLVVVDRQDLEWQILAPFFETQLDMKQREARQEASAFVTAMAERSGLLDTYHEGRRAVGYTFGDHLTVQEFLAAAYLAENVRGTRTWLGLLQGWAGRSWWREVLLLLAGQLIDKPEQVKRFLLDELGDLPADAPEARAYGQAWAGRALLEIPARVGGWYMGTRKELALRLVSVLRQNPPQTTVAARVEAGEVLGSLGDPRFSDGLCLPEFIPISGGEFWMGSTEEEVARVVAATGKDWAKRELPRHRVHVDSFALAKYPTTHAMYAAFMADEGYQNPAWWEGMPKGSWLSRGHPYYWDDERFSGRNQPVVGVTWYEAAAYCRWLTARLDDGRAYRLPTEAEWERAARGEAERRYAWGDGWDVGKANTEALDLKRTTPAGVFPDGATPEGLLDMTGNVWEWCSDWYGKYRGGNRQHNPQGPDGGQYKVVRGGSWYNDRHWVRCAFRGYYPPDDDVSLSGGFRVARGSLPGRPDG